MGEMFRGLEARSPDPNAHSSAVREAGAQLYKLHVVLDAEFTHDLLDILLNILEVWVCGAFFVVWFCTNAACINKDSGAGLSFVPLKPLALA